MIVVIIVAALTAIMGIVVLAGKGDMLIAGYNTASKAEREKYDIKRLRLVIGILLIIVGLLCLLLLEESLEAGFAFASVTLILTAVALALANTWAKKKTK